MHVSWTNGLYLYMVCLREKFDRENGPVAGLTTEGRIAVMVNLLRVVAVTIHNIEREIVSSDPSVWLYNSFIVSALTSLQTFLDVVARFCYDESSDDRQDPNIYFVSHTFHHMDLQPVSQQQTVIRGLQFEGRSFNDLVNYVKHTMPWVGLHTTNTHGEVDIFDCNGKGVLRNMVCPAYDAGVVILKHLAKKKSIHIRNPYTV